MLTADRSECTTGWRQRAGELSRFTLADTEDAVCGQASGGAADRAQALYEYFVERCASGRRLTQTGHFAADIRD